MGVFSRGSFDDILMEGSQKLFDQKSKEITKDEEYCLFPLVKEVRGIFPVIFHKVHIFLREL